MIYGGNLWYHLASKMGQWTVSIRSQAVLRWPSLRRKNNDCKWHKEKLLWQPPSEERLYRCYFRQFEGAIYHGRGRLKACWQEAHIHCHRNEADWQACICTLISTLVQRLAFCPGHLWWPNFIFAVCLFGVDHWNDSEGCVTDLHYMKRWVLAVFLTACLDIQGIEY